MSPTPILCEDAREQFLAEELEATLRTMIDFVKATEFGAQVKAHVHWRHHWRTRLSRFLHRIAERIELPEPPDPRGEDGT